MEEQNIMAAVKAEETRIETFVAEQLAPAPVVEVVTPTEAPVVEVVTPTEAPVVEVVAPHVVERRTFPTSPNGDMGVTHIIGS